MRILYPPINTYDILGRDPLPIHKNYEAVVAPHAPTERFSYTVPADRMAYIHTVSSTIYRVGAAAPVGNAYAEHWFDTVSGNFGAMLVNHYDNNLNSRVREWMQSGLLLVEGDIVSLDTADVSTGGLLYFLCNAFLTEFNSF